ncbi:MAG: glycosyltransferase [Bacteriovoracia bacterium]
MNFVIIAPVWNDWLSAEQLCLRLERELAPAGHQASLWFVDDGSTDKLPEGKKIHGGSGIREINVIELYGNQGHQRAIATGLAHLFSSGHACDGFLLMDCDGEDKPSAVPALLAAQAQNPGSIVVAQRARRFENIFFRLGYFFYKKIFFLFTGKSIAFGNFIFLPLAHAESLCHSQYTASHVAAAVVRLGLPCVSIKVDRGRRYAGTSRMNFVSLVLHGLNAIAVFSEIVLTRVILFSLFLMAACLAGIAAVVTIRLSTNLAIPGWATYVSLLLLMIIFQSLFAAVFLCFLHLSQKQGFARTPLADAKNLVKGVRKISS